MKLPATLTIDDVIDACERDEYEGYCLACGAQHDNIEPDARGYRCEVCRAPAVFGAQEILIGCG